VLQLLLLQQGLAAGLWKPSSRSRPLHWLAASSNHHHSSGIFKKIPWIPPKILEILQFAKKFLF
jgi:hypothetical protein